MDTLGTDSVLTSGMKQEIIWKQSGGLLFLEAGLLCGPFYTTLHHINMPAKCKKASSPPAHQDEFERSGLYDFEDDDPRPPPKAWKRIQQESEDNETSSSDESENTNEVDDPRRKKSRRYTEKSKQVIARGIDKDEEGCTPTSGSNIQVPMKQFILVFSSSS
mmetsp:Transcript_24926/g.34898  ORF Transcript_24926/g.34898 Transcript_24926/m.34898 type:complete len:162 (-) Transcript_24926:368-853(-)